MGATAEIKVGASNGVIVVEVLKSSDGVSAKLIQAVRTGPIVATFETGRYLVPDEVRGPEDIVCLSPQIGCAMACSFCKTTEPYEYFPGRPQRILRSLMADEIVEQAENAIAAVPPRDSQKIVFSYMGMGEPMANSREVKESIVELGTRYPSTRATVCTIAHNLRAIENLADEVAGGTYPIPVKLHISIHGSTDEIRRAIVPYAKPLEETLDAGEYFAKVTGTKVKLNYVLVNGVNSTDEDAHRLGILLKTRQGLVLKISDLNPPTAMEHVSNEEADQFEKIVRSYNVQTCRFSSHGTDILAGCGELVKGKRD